MSDGLKKKIINVLVVLVALPCFELVKRIMEYTKGYSSIGELLFIVGLVGLIYLGILLLSILLVNICITIIMLIQCSSKKQKVTDIYFMPFHYDVRNKKIKIKGMSAFSSNYVIYEIEDLLGIEQYESFKLSIKKRNEGIIVFVLFWIIILFLVSFLLENLYIGILGIAMVLQLMVQSRFHLRYHCRGISTIVDDGYMLQFISNQLMYQDLHLSQNVIYHLKETIEAIEIYRFYIDIFRVLLIHKGVIDHQDKFIEVEMGKLMRENCYDYYRYPLIKGKNIGDFYSHFFEHRYLFMLYIIRGKGDYLKRTKEFIEKHIQLINENHGTTKDFYIKSLLDEFTKFETEYIEYYEGKFEFPEENDAVSITSSYRKEMEREFLDQIIYPEM